MKKLFPMLLRPSNRLWTSFYTGQVGIALVYLEDIIIFFWLQPNPSNMLALHCRWSTEHKSHWTCINAGPSQRNFTPWDIWYTAVYWNSLLALQTQYTFTTTKKGNGTEANVYRRYVHSFNWASASHSAKVRNGQSKEFDNLFTGKIDAFATS